MDPNGVSRGRGGDAFIDRSKVRILLCDNDSKGSGEVFTLLCKCSYQVISVKSPRQVIDALNAEGANIDIILSEVDLPMAKGLKMLKYIMRKELQRIPIIMMSAQDEVTLVVKCLRLGAADYLVKPLRTNELLNLWTHMWRRRRMLGLTEKKVMNCEFDFMPSDHSDVNTNSSMLSDDMDENLRKNFIPENSISIHHRDEINVILAPDYAETQGQFMSGPKKSKLKIGQSSAFFTYVKSTTTPDVFVPVNETTPLSRLQKEPNLHAGMASPPVNLFGQNLPQKVNPCGDTYHTQPSANLSHTDYAYQFHQGAMNQVMMTSSSMFHHMPTMTSFPYYPPFNHGQMVQPYGSASSNDAIGQNQSQSQKVDRREAALLKFRQKRKERCFDKKIRYINRKKLAERRPRVRGQFVRKVNGIDVDLNGQPTCTDEDYEDEDYQD